MEVVREEGLVSIRLTNAEAARLGFALRAGYETLSRAEYYIRTGLSQPQVRGVAAVLINPDRPSTATITHLEPGIEELENPRRARPSL